MIFETAHTPFGDLLFYTEKRKAQKIKEEFENGTWEKEVTDLILELDYTHFIDVGAGFGYYSLMAGKTSRQRCTVTAFEPHPIRYGLAVWNCREQENIEVLPSAISGEPAFDFTNPADFGHAMGGDYTQLLPHLNHTQLWFSIADNEDTLIKIDVEGMELDVLRTVNPIAAYPRAMWIVEYHRGWKHHDIDPQEIKDYFGDRFICEEIGKRNHLFFRRAQGASVNSKVAKELAGEMDCTPMNAIITPPKTKPPQK